jgi:flavodoxin
MKRTLILAAMATLLFSACGPKTPKVLVLYYSQTDHTRTVAQEIQKALGADIEEVLCVKPYDGTYQETVNRAGEERAKGIFPELEPIKADLSQYDIIFLGYPVWYGTISLPMAGLVERVDFAGKKLVPFCTFGSGGLQTSAAELAVKEPNATVLPGYGVRAARMDAVPAEVDYFLKSNGYIKGEFTPLEEFPEQEVVSEEQAALFDAAVGDYPMIQAKATMVACRPVPGGTEYKFTAENLPREGVPQFSPSEITVYVLVEDGKAPVFTQVVR